MIKLEAAARLRMTSGLTEEGFKDLSPSEQKEYLAEHPTSEHQPDGAKPDPKPKGSAPSKPKTSAPKQAQQKPLRKLSWLQKRSTLKKIKELDKKLLEQFKKLTKRYKRAPADELDGLEKKIKNIKKLTEDLHDYEKRVRAM